MKQLILSTCVVATIALTPAHALSFGSNHHNTDNSIKNTNVNANTNNIRTSNANVNRNANLNANVNNVNTSNANVNRANNTNRVNATDINNIRNHQGQSQGQHQSAHSNSKSKANSNQHQSTASSSDNNVQIDGDNIRYDVAASSVPSSMATQCGSSAAAQTVNGGVSYSGSSPICDNLIVSNALYERAIAMQTIDPALASELLEESNELLGNASQIANGSKPAGFLEKALSPIVKLAAGIFGILGL